MMRVPFFLNIYMYIVSNIEDRLIKFKKWWWYICLSIPCSTHSFEFHRISQRMSHATILRTEDKIKERQHVRLDMCVGLHLTSIGRTFKHLSEIVIGKLSAVLTLMNGNLIIEHAWNVVKSRHRFNSIKLRLCVCFPSSFSSKPLNRTA